MKKTYLFLVSAAMIFAGCTNDEYLGNAEDVQNTNGAIMFSPKSAMLTRGTLFNGDAAGKLSNNFVVYGTKHVAAEDKTATNDAVVFNQYHVNWNGNPGSTQSNTAGWEYVGQASYSSGITSQSVKYWDYSADNGYTFTAFSSPEITYPQDATSDKVVVNKIPADASGTVYTKGYQMQILPTADKSKIYFSDRVVVPESDYGKTVSLTFRNMGAKVRVGFYETIPGYKVKIKSFRIDDDATAPVTTFAAMKDAYTAGFAASMQNYKTDVAQVVNITYYDNSNPTIENRPKVSNPTNGYYYTLKLGAGVVGTDLSTQTSAPTWDKTDGAYTEVFPCEENVNPMILKLDFTMTSEDGNGEVIEVKGARAVVPAEYCQWRSNFAYTYIFKISDATNGTTGAVDANDEPTDPTGLKPITFDAVVVDAETDQTQQTITTIADNSITTYQNGVAHETTNEYNTGDIYVALFQSGYGDVTPSGIGTAATQAQVYTVTTVNDRISESSVFAKLTGSNNGLTLTPVTTTPTIESGVPMADGTTKNIPNVKFNATAAGTYAYVYTHAAYVAPTYTAVGAAAYDAGTTYYMVAGGVYYPVTVANAAAYNENKANLYTKTADGTPGQYDIKVIKVQ